VTKFVIFGLGFLGSYVFSEIKSNNFVGLGTNFEHSTNNESMKIDIRKIDFVQKLLENEKPEIVINCVALGKIDFLEKNPEMAYSVNSSGAQNIAVICKKNNIRMIHISTDSVFDGTKNFYTEDESTNPLNVYAKSKILAEQHILNSCNNSVIIRTNFYGYDPNGNWFLNWIIDSLKQGKQLTGYQDIHFNPLEISNLSKLIVELSLTDFTGIIHLSSDQALSKYNFIKKVIEIFDFNPNLLKKGFYTTDPRVINRTVAPRPKNTVLSNKLLKTFLKTPLISLDDSLKNIKTTFYI